MGGQVHTPCAAQPLRCYSRHRTAVSVSPNISRAAQSDVSPNLHGTHRPRTLLADDSRVARTHNPAVEQADMTRGARGETTGIALARARASPGPWPRARPSFWPASTAAAAAAAKTAAARRLHEHTIERPEGLGLSAVARPRHA